MTTQGAPIKPGSDPIKWSQTNYNYNSQGLQHRLPTLTVTTASDSSQSHTVTIDNLNNYGLPTSVTTTGQGQGTGSSLTRSVRTSYSSDGYFPATVTQENGSYDLVTSSNVSPLHGQPLTVTDANNNTVTHTYDGFWSPAGRARCLVGKPSTKATNGATAPVHRLKQHTMRSANKQAAPRLSATKTV